MITLGEEPLTYGVLAVEFVAPVIVATVVGEALFRLAVYYSY